MSVWTDIGDAVLVWVLNILYAVAIWYIGSYAIRKGGEVLHRVLTLNKELDKAIKGFIESIYNFALKFVLVMIVMARVGIDNTSFIAIGGAAVFALAFSMQDSMASFASGVMLLVLKHISVGDYVVIGGDELTGQVKSIELFVSTLITNEGHTVIIPNAEITGASITNLSKRGTVRADVDFPLLPQDDVFLAKEIMIDVMEEHPLVLDAPVPKAVVSELDQEQITMQAQPWVKAKDLYQVKFDVREQCLRRFRDAGIALGEDEDEGEDSDDSDDDEGETGTIAVRVDKIKSRVLANIGERLDNTGYSDDEDEDEDAARRTQRVKSSASGEGVPAALSSDALAALKDRKKGK